MRKTTRKVHDALEGALNSDERLATRCDVLVEWILKAKRFTHEKRLEAVADIHKRCDDLLGEFETFKKEIEYIAGELRGNTMEVPQIAHEPLAEEQRPKLKTVQS